MSWIANILWPGRQRYSDQGAAAVLVVDTQGNPVSVGGATLSDVLLSDANSVLFIARDNGTAISYARIDTGAAYTPVAPIVVADSLALGVAATGIAQPAGGVGSNGWLSGILDALRSIYTRLSGGIAVSNFPASQTVAGAVSVSNLPATQAVSAASLPLPTGAATAANQPTINADGGAQVHVQNFPATQPISGSVAVANFPASQTIAGTVTANIGTTAGLASDASVQQVVAAIKAQAALTSSVWFDNTAEPVKYYVRRESLNEGTGVILVSFENPDGTIAAPTMANLMAVANAEELAPQTMTYTATAAGTGYAIGDVLMHTFGINTTAVPMIVEYQFWLNSTAGTTLASAPTAGSYTQVVQPVSIASLPLPALAAQDGVDATGVVQLAGGVGIRGWLSGIFSKLSNMLSLLTSGISITSIADDADQMITGNIITQNLNATGAATAGSAITFSNLSKMATAVAQISGTYTGTLAVQASQDNLQWSQLSANGLISVLNGGYTNFAFTSGLIGLFGINITGMRFFRLVATTPMTGTAVVSMSVTRNVQQVSLSMSLPVGGNGIGYVGIGPTTFAGYTSQGRLLSAASTNATLVKAAAANVGLINLINTGAATRFFKVGNIATPPVPGTTVPVLTIPMPPNVPITIQVAAGIRLSAGFGFWITAVAADLDSTAVAANEVVVNYAYV